MTAIEAALPGYIERSRALADALAEIGCWHFESGQIAGFVQNTTGQVEVAANFTLAELKAMPDAICEGRQAIPGEPAAMPAPVPEPPPTMMLFMMRSAHYRDHDGCKKFARQWEDVAMPVATAQRALRQGVAVPLTDPKRARLRGARGGDFNPNAPDVVDLDAAEQPKNMVHTDPVFTVIDRSAEARTIQIEVPRR